MKIFCSYFFLVSILFSKNIYAANDIVVSQKAKAFSADSIEISVGDSIVFKNDDETSHNVFSVTVDQNFNGGITKPGAEIRRKFDVPGELEVRCAIHPKMKLKIKVK